MEWIERKKCGLPIQWMEKLGKWTNRILAWWRSAFGAANKKQALESRAIDSDPPNEQTHLTNKDWSMTYSRSKHRCPRSVCSHRSREALDRDPTPPDPLSLRGQSHFLFPSSSGCSSYSCSSSFYHPKDTSCSHFPKRRNAWLWKWFDSHLKQRRGATKQ